MSRKSDKALSHHFYKRRYPYGPDICTYCGDPANSDDHVTPLSLTSIMADNMNYLGHKYRKGLVIVPSCRDCNKHAGDFPATSIQQKRAEIHRRIRRKHKKLLESPEWTPKEIAQLGYSLRMYVMMQEARRYWIKLRLGWPQNGYKVRRPTFSFFDAECGPVVAPPRPTNP